MFNHLKNSRGVSLLPKADKNVEKTIEEVGFPCHFAGANFELSISVENKCIKSPTKTTSQTLIYTLQ